MLAGAKVWSSVRPPPAGWPSFWRSLLGLARFPPQACVVRPSQVPSAPPVTPVRWAALSLYRFSSPSDRVLSGAAPGPSLGRPHLAHGRP